MLGSNILMENDTNSSPNHLIFKSTIRFVKPTLGPTNPMMDLKFDCMEMVRE
jgi:hypothetical protein